MQTSSYGAVYLVCKSGTEVQTSKRNIEIVNAKCTKSNRKQYNSDYPNELGTEIYIRVHILVYI